MDNIENDREFTVRDCISGKAVKYRIDFWTLSYAGHVEDDVRNIPFAGPGHLKMVTPVQVRVKL